MPIDGDVARALDEVDTLRAERDRMKRELSDQIAQTLELSGVSGMWAKLRGSYDRQVEEAERRVAELRGALEITEAAVDEAEVRLAQVRDAAVARSGAEAEGESSPEVPSPAPVSEVEVLPAHAVAERLQAVERLETVLKPLLPLAPELSARARTVAEARRSASRRRRRTTLLSLMGEAQTDSTLDRLRRNWEDHLGEAVVLAAQLDVPLQLPSMGDASHAASAWSLEAFAEQVDDIALEVQALLDRLQDTHRQLRQTTAPDVDPGADRGARVQALIGRWERLFELGLQLDRACVPGVKTSALLGLVAAWNNEATAAAELAEALELSLRPPINDGGNLVRFVQDLREALPALHERVEALR